MLTWRGFAREDRASSQEKIQEGLKGEQGKGRTAFRRLGGEPEVRGPEHGLLPAECTPRHQPAQVRWTEGDGERRT